MLAINPPGYDRTLRLPRLRTRRHSRTTQSTSQQDNPVNIAAPNTKSAKKALLKSRERYLRNRSTKSAIKTYSRRVKELADKGDTEGSIATLRRAISLIDKAVKRGILHKNTGNRKKSRLMVALNKKLAQQQGASAEE
jgi:small subunit ribosomal protein S20